MGVEVTSTIAGLDASWPLSNDVTNEGDNHLRLVKNVLKFVFPGVGAQGFAIPITATEEELNYVSGVTSPVQDQIDALNDAVGGVEGVLTAPSGTIMLFFNATAPAGWTINPYLNNRMIRVVTAVGAAGGTDNPISWTHAHGTQAVALSVSQLPAHYHAISGGNDGVVFGSGSGGGNVNGGTFDMGDTQYTGSGQAHTHGNTLTTSFNPLYADAMSAIKD